MSIVESKDKGRLKFYGMNVFFFFLISSRPRGTRVRERERKKERKEEKKSQPSGYAIAFLSLFLRSNRKDRIEKGREKNEGRKGR